MKRISKRVRDDAALICNLAASSGEEGLGVFQVTKLLRGVEDRGDLALTLSVAAFQATLIAYWEWERYGQYQIRCAEAEALIRTGWSPE